MEFIGLSADEKRFIQEHSRENVQQLLLRHHRTLLDIRKLAAQIAARQRAQDKLPSWCANPDIVFPPGVSLEQSSSEQTALYKARLVSEIAPTPKRVVDLTGGMGVDSWALSDVADQLTYVERQPELARLAAHNLPQLKATNVTVLNDESYNALNGLDSGVDWIYLDPARRDDRGGKVVELEDCEPDVVALWPTLLEKANHLLLKTSPLIDVDAVLRQLSGIQAVHVVAVQHEVKEVLFVAQRHYTPADDVSMTAVDLTKAGNITFSFQRSEERSVAVTFANPQTFIYEPNAPVLKAGAFRLVADRFGLAKLGLHSHLYTSDEYISGFPGRIFRLDAVCKPTRDDLQSVVPGMKANLTVRNFPQTVDQLRKQLKLKEGGDVYVLATTLQHGDKRLLVTRKA